MLLNPDCTVNLDSSLCVTYPCSGKSSTEDSNVARSQTLLSLKHAPDAHFLFELSNRRGGWLDFALEERLVYWFVRTR